MRSLFLFFGFMIACEAASAQDLPANPLDDKYTPASGSYLNPGNNKGLKGTRGRSDHKNLFGFNPVLLGRRIATFSYGRTVTKRVFVRVSAGLSFQADPVLINTSWLFMETPEYSELSEDADDVVWFSEYMSNGSGRSGNHLFYEGALRVFLDDDDIQNSSYLEMGYREYNNQFVYNNSQLYTDHLLNLNSKTVNFQFGRTLTSGSFFVHDLYCGFGIRFYQVDKLKPVFEVDQYGNNDLVSLSPSNEKINVTGFSIVLGYAFHFGF